jgi:hypothetical protein
MKNTQLEVVNGAVSVVNPTDNTNKGGRPTLYAPEVVDRLLGALADGLTIKQACVVSGISESTLSDWRERYSDLETRLAPAREQARQKALAGIKAAGEGGDWRAWAAYLTYSFQSDYRKDASVNVTATAAVQTQAVVCDEKTRVALIEQRKRLLATDTLPAKQNSLAEAQGSARAIPESSAAMSKKV